MIYFTSDLHLGHANVISFNARPFADVIEMNDTLIENINKSVEVDDELWVLDDFSYGISKEEVRGLRKRIRCKQVHLVYGNHDRDYSQNHIFQSVQHYKEIKTPYGKIVLFHYPIMEWNAAHYGTIHLHGHIHSTSEYNYDNRGRLFRDRFPNGHPPRNEDLPLRVFDVGVDANNYRPVSLSDIASWMGLDRN